MLQAYPVRAALEERRASPENDRVDPEAIFVDQAVRHKGCGEIGAAEHEDVSAIPGLQLGNFFRDIVVEELRVVPIGAFQRARENHLLDLVHEVRDPALLGRPIGCHELVGHSAEDQRAGLFLGLTNVVLEFFFEDEPTDVPGGTFEEAVDGYHVPYDQFSHGALLLVYHYCEFVALSRQAERMLMIRAAPDLGLLQPDRLHDLPTDAVADKDGRDMDEDLVHSLFGPM